jgi:glycosyltransferase involved in cell wall biosynthesis
MMRGLSVVIVAQDEERTIGQVLDSIKAIANEIILVDSGSSDKTIDIAKSCGAMCHHQEWLGYAQQKNFAISLAKCEWILSLDADEVVSAPLLKEIETVLSQPEGENFDGYRIPRYLYIGNTALCHGGFYPDAQLRLFKRGKGEFKPRMVHEAVTVNGKVGHLKEAMRHYAYTDFEAFENAMDKYARLSAQEFATKGDVGWRISKVNELLHPWWTFLYKYLFRGGFLDGEMGLKANWIYRNYVRKKITYLREAVTK